MTLLRRITSKVRRFKLREAAKNVFLIVSVLLIFDTLLAVLGAPYLSENVTTFLGKSTTVILSDLLFLEGAVILAVGIFVAVAKAGREIKPSSEPTKEKTDNAEPTREKPIHAGILMIIVGATLAGLSIMVGMLLL